MIAYKLLRVRADGTLGPLFINRRQRIPVNVWVKAEPHPTKGYKFRPGWHACHAPRAPHLTEKGRRWYVVDLRQVTEFLKPPSQGGLWYTAKHMRVVKPVC